MVRKLLALSLLLVFGCIANIKSVVNEKRDLLSFYVLADSSLSDDRRAAIYDALAEWDIKTGQHIRYVIRFDNMYGENENPNDYSNIYKIMMRPLGNQTLGLTGHNASNNSAIIYLRNDLYGNIFKSVLLHELGHAMDLHFERDPHYKGPYKSIMHPMIGNTDKLECPELMEFCHRYICEMSCDYEKLPPWFAKSRNRMFIIDN